MAVLVHIQALSKLGMASVLPPRIKLVQTLTSLSMKKTLLYILYFPFQGWKWSNPNNILVNLLCSVITLLPYGNQNSALCSTSGLTGALFTSAGSCILWLSHKSKSPVCLPSLPNPHTLGTCGVLEWDPLVSLFISIPFLMFPQHCLSSPNAPSHFSKLPPSVHLASLSISSCR